MADGKCGRCGDYKYDLIFCNNCGVGYCRDCHYGDCPACGQGLR